jgi:hypothetical protein
MKLTTDLVNKILIEVIKAGTGLKNVIVETRNAVRPSTENYATIYWQQIDTLPIYNGDNSFDKDTDTELVLLPAQCKVQLSIFGKDAFNTTINLAAFLQSNLVQFSTHNIIGLSNIDTVQDISTTIGGKIEERASVDIQFYCEFNREFTMDYFEFGKIILKFIGDGSIVDIIVPDTLNINNSKEVK